MSTFKCRITVCLLLSAHLVASYAHAYMVQAMDLAEICSHADKVFRGKVLSITEGTVEVGGGELPTRLYRFEVQESFKGGHETIKGIPIVELKMIARPKTAAAWPLPEMPQLEVGGEYVLMTSTPSHLGLATTIGVSQGCFTIAGQGKTETASNGAGTTVTYDELAARIGAALGQ